MQKIIFTNEQDFRNKVGAIKVQGLDSLHIISDFDMTLTRPSGDGKKAVSTWETFELSDEYVRERDRLVSIYQPIEFDPNIPLDIKKVKMQEWWSLHLEDIMMHGLTRKLIQDSATYGRIILREGLEKLCEFTHTRNIPFLIFSAGLGDVITELFSSRNIMRSNMHIVSNFFIFDSDGNPTGFKDDIVHSFNKTEVHLKGKPYVGEIINRNNLILLGDSLGDAAMGEGFPHKNIIKICFLNGRLENLNAYKELYDVIIIEDESMDFVLELLENLK